MHIMAKVAEPFGGLEKIPFGAALKIQTFMRQRDFHRGYFSWL
jgi:hypothetical protein